MRGKCAPLEHITIIEKSIRGGGGGGEEKELTATSDLATFLISMIAPVKIPVNHLRTVVSMHALNPMAPVPNYFSLRSL